jgi:hypothetical protein
MNRLSLFKQALPTWVRFPFKNIYVLNWNSDDGEELHNFIKSFNDSRIIIEDVFGKRTTYFNAPISRNMAAERCVSLTEPKYLLQIDCDIKLNDTFEHILLRPEIIYMASWCKFLSRPNWEETETRFQKNSGSISVVTRERLKYGDLGTVLMPVSKLWLYGYYNENFIENNLFDVYYLSKYFNYDNYDNIWYFRDEISHINHDNELRMSCGPEKDMVRAVMINRALKDLPPHRYPYNILECGKIRID